MLAGLLRVRSTVNFLSRIFSPYLEKFGACYIKGFFTGQWSEFRVKNATLCLHSLLWHFLVFFIKKIVFIIFISFFDKVSNSLNRIITNQKMELVIRNRQWNCMFFSLSSLRFQKIAFNCNL